MVLVWLSKTIFPNSNSTYYKGLSLIIFVFVNEKGVPDDGQVGQDHSATWNGLHSWALHVTIPVPVFRTDRWLMIAKFVLQLQPIHPVRSSLRLTALSIFHRARLSGLFLFTETKPRPRFNGSGSRTVQSSRTSYQGLKIESVHRYASYYALDDLNSVQSTLGHALKFGNKL